MRTTRIAVLLCWLVGLAVTSLSLSACSPEAEAADYETVVLDVTGMSCQVMCAPELKAHLEGRDDISTAEVSCEEGTAVCQMKKGTDAAALASSVSAETRFELSVPQ